MPIGGISPMEKEEKPYFLNPDLRAQLTGFGELCFCISAIEQIGLKYEKKVNTSAEKKPLLQTSWKDENIIYTRECPITRQVVVFF